MSYQELVARRYSVRKFSQRPVEPEKLALILNAARLAPTAVNRQPQRILVLRSREQLDKLPRCTRSSFGCTLALLVCYDTTASWKRKFDGMDSGVIDASIVTDQMMMAATELGLGTTWVCSFDPVAMRETFEIPAELEPVNLLVMGYPAEDAAPGSLHGVRKPLEETVFYDGF